MTRKWVIALVVATQCVVLCELIVLHRTIAKGMRWLA